MPSVIQRYTWQQIFCFSSKEHYIKYFQLVYSINISKFKQNNQPSKKNLLTQATTLASHTHAYTQSFTGMWRLQVCKCFHTHCKHKTTICNPTEVSCHRSALHSSTKKMRFIGRYEEKNLCSVRSQNTQKPKISQWIFFFSRKPVLQQNCFASFSINKWILTWCFLSLYPLTNDWIIIAFFSLRLSSWKKEKKKKNK